MATDGIAEIDLSGTDVIGYSGVGDSASAQIIRYSDPTLFFADNPQIGQAFQNYDGGRLARVRYDTPSFTASASPSPSARICCRATRTTATSTSTTSR